jgi:hypothetical protein
MLFVMSLKLENATKLKILLNLRPRAAKMLTFQ